MRNRYETGSIGMLSALNNAASTGSDLTRLVVSKVSEDGTRLSHHCSEFMPKANPDFFVDNFCSCSYLGVFRDKEVQKIAHDTIDEFGVGYYGPSPLSGESTPHAKLCKSISSSLQMPFTFLFVSASMANFGVIPMVVGPGDVILSDAENHNTIIHGCELSGAKVITYRHNDMEDLENKISRVQFNSKLSNTVPSSNNGCQPRILIVTDGIFSMSGDTCKLPKLVDLRDRFAATLMVDDCHSYGVIGERGFGTTEYYGLLGKADIITGTLGKALGACGGFASVNERIYPVMQYSMGRVFSSGTAPLHAACANHVVERLLAKESYKPLTNLKKNIQLWNSALKQKVEPLGYKIIDSPSAIKSIMVGSTSKIFDVQRKCYEKGLYCTGIVYPAVPRGSELLRTTVSGSMSEEQILGACDTLSRVLSQD